MKAFTLTKVLAGVFSLALMSPVFADDMNNNMNNDATANTTNDMSSDNGSSSNALSDSAITADVKGKLAAEQTLTPFVIEVTTNNGVVILTGEVETDDNAEKAVELSQSADGVNDVVTTALIIKQPSRPLEDTYITAKVKGMYLKEKLFGDKNVDMGVKVDTTAGVVHLSGTVKSEAEKENAINLAKKVKGVQSVESTIEVMSQ